ncbi:hemolysin III [Jatrophihabitans endophyticus]|uniref:Hemolysin III n=1 Tax=Jatrophihabitans endophyticus TaxID=1206085 RepID=A0A1M5SXA4_9ACTN|nr:hemolysin III family protein [Jatrophihabitans endophyticus]SHH43157.1 hemolysin III [Jatrophihabitans endophyticus]
MTTVEPGASGPVAAIAHAVAELKPRLRGWLHAYAALVSLASGAALVATAASLRGGVAALVTAVYCATVTMLFGTSALYHRLSWSPTAQRVMKRLDHSMIFVFIAGTYTPIAALTLPEGAMVAVLIAVWAGAALGVSLQLVWPSSPRWLSAPCYIALGWVAAFVFPDLLHNSGVAAFVLIAAGGVVYTVGGVVYALKRPNPWPGVFGFHEVFHLCTLVAALCHYVAIWFAVFA